MEGRVCTILLILYVVINGAVQLLLVTRIDELNMIRINDRDVVLLLELQSLAIFVHLMRYYLQCEL